MKISVFGMGYVGVVTAACLAQKGNVVIGVDINQKKVNMINEGISPIIEKDLSPIIEKNVKSGSLTATNIGREAILNTDITLLCVGTPSLPNGSLDLKYVLRVVNEIGTILKEKESYHTVVLRSTIIPGTTENIVIPELERSSGKLFEKEFSVVYNPEFMRESTAVSDFYNPPVIVIGAKHINDYNTTSELYSGITAQENRTSIKVAEMIKYANNAFHALKVTFANEIGNICKGLSINSHEVMDIFCADKVLNLSNYYLKPGFSFGGSCLPKDIRALTYLAKSMDLDLPVLNSIISSNKKQIDNVVNRIILLNKKRIGILGMAFKSGTDDLRESPMVALTEILLGKGYQIKIYDKDVALATLYGSNKDYIENHIPHIASLMVGDMEKVAKFSDIILIGNKSKEFLNVLPLLKKDQLIIDLVKISKEISTEANYDGICW